MSTQPICTASTYEMRDAADAVRHLTIHFGELPAPYLTMHTYPGSGTTVNVQLDNPTAFEMWREALELDADDVTLFPNGDESWLKVEGTVRTATAGGTRVPVSLTGFGLSVVSARETEQVAS